MLTISTYLDRSTIHGIGLFANEDISKGALLWKATEFTYVPVSIEKRDQMKSELSKESFSQLDSYWVKENGGYFICIDNARFVNHSKENCNTHYDSVAKELFSSKEIKKGEEILEDYDVFYPEEGSHLYPSVP
jgi:SET domain-containing protein